jgi:hypothetical protein
VHTLAPDSVRLFDRARTYWESARHQHRAGTFVILAFIGGLVAIECSRRGWMPPLLRASIPTNHFYAVDLAFTLVLLMEVIAVVFGLADSVAKSVGTQLEIFSLILLRQTFKEFTGFDEPVTWTQVAPSVLQMASDATGALLIFVLLGVYYHLQRHQPITSIDDRASFVVAKKIIALVLLGTFAAIGLHDALAWTEGRAYPFFEAFYTVLIFSDLLLVLISLRYSATYHVVFRNSGFTVSAVFMRLAQVAPPIVNAGLGLLAAVFACGVTVAYNRFGGGESAAAAGTQPSARAA